MIVLANRFTLDFYGNDSPDRKGSEIKKLLRLVQRKFSIDCAEVDAFQDPEKCVLAFVVVGNSESKLKKRVEIISAFIDKNSFARVVDEGREIFRSD